MRQILRRNDRAETAVNRSVEVIVSVLVMSLLAAYLVPVAVGELATVDTSGWPAGAAEMWGLLSVMIVLAIFLFFVQAAVNTR